jgi:D-sedoheptulose 7-phosphate isomerase
VALTADTAALTCIANDFGYDAVFARQVEGLGQPGDLLVCFSTSGNSSNVIAALHAARPRC